MVLFRDTSDIYFGRPRDGRQLWVLSLLESPENTETLTAYDEMVSRRKGTSGIIRSTTQRAIAGTATW